MTLLLDPDIRDWVVLPLFVIIVLAGLLRGVVSQYLQGAKEPIPDTAQRAHNLLKQGLRIRSSAANYLSQKQWFARKQHAIDMLREEADYLQELHEKQKEEGTGPADPMEAMMSNPMSMLGGNMVFMVQNMVMMQAIQHFFSGFILLKVPFALTAGFKNMFQRGVADLPDLEPAYVSSVSWYFLVMYGLRSFFKLAIGMPPHEVKEQDILLHSMGLQNPSNNPTAKKQDPETMAKLLRQEADNLEMLVHKSEFDGVEKRLLQSRYPKKKLSSSKDADFLLGSKKSTSKKKRQ